MRKNLNSLHVEGYVYDCSKLNMRESGPTSKNPGTPFINGEVEVAVDELGLNIIPVHFTYVTEVFAKSGKKNNTYTTLQTLIANADKTWLKGGKDEALKISIDGTFDLNDFFSADGERVSAKRCEGSFASIVSSLKEDEGDRNKFQLDMVITRTNHVDADPDKHIDHDYVTIGGAAFNFRNELLPLELTIRNPGGMKYFEDLGVTNSEPVYTKVWGHINSQTIKIERTEESAFGDAEVTVYERKNREWVVTGTAKVPYDFGEDEVMTADELTEAAQNREVKWAEIKKRNDEYLASRNSVPKTAAPKAAIKTGGFSF